MLLLKACPRCRRGDLIIERDRFGPTVSCLQCGYYGDLAAVRRELALGRVPARRNGSKVKAA